MRYSKRDHSKTNYRSKEISIIDRSDSMTDHSYDTSDYTDSDYTTDSDSINNSISNDKTKSSLTSSKYQDLIYPSHDTDDCCDDVTEVDEQDIIDEVLQGASHEETSHEETSHAEIVAGSTYIYMEDSVDEDQYKTEDHDKAEMKYKTEDQYEDEDEDEYIHPIPLKTTIEEKTITYMAVNLDKPALNQDDFDYIDYSNTSNKTVFYYHQPELIQSISQGFGKHSYKAYYQSHRNALGELLQSNLQSQNLKQQLTTFLSIAKVFKNLEDQEAPPLHLALNQIFITENHQLSILVGYQGVTWSCTLAQLLMDCLLNNYGLSTESLNREAHYLACLDIVSKYEILPPSMLSVLRNALINRISMKAWILDFQHSVEQYQKEKRSLVRTKGQLKNSDQLDNTHTSAHHTLKRRSSKRRKSDHSSRTQKQHMIQSMDVGCAQRVGRYKITRSKNNLKSTHLQQEDRVWSGSFIFQDQTYWLSFVLDGVSTCSYASGAHVAELGYQFILDKINHLDQEYELVEAAREDSGLVILEWLYGAMHKHIRTKLTTHFERYISESDVNHDTIHHPSSTISFTLSNQVGHTWLAWVGDSPILRYRAQNQKLDVMNYSHSHGIESIQYNDDSLDILESLNAADASMLTRNVFQSNYDDLEVRECMLDADDLLMICSDGLIDGFVSAHQSKVAQSQYALNTIEEHLSTLYAESPVAAHIAEDLSYLADKNNGVDNISLVVTRANFK